MEGKEMIRLHIEVDEKAWEKLMWALEHEEPIKWDPDPKVREWIRTLNDPERMKEVLNAIDELIEREKARAAKEPNKR